MRADREIIQQWIRPGARVLDLGCGTGELLDYLTHERRISGYGLEIDPDNINACLARGVNVIEQDLNHGLSNIHSDSFDVVVMTQALQTIDEPRFLLDEMLRVASECIITFPNFGYWRCRMHLAAYGRMPVSGTLPYSWYDTPNIHLCTFRDFEALCRESDRNIIERNAVDEIHRSNWLARLWPNLLGQVAIYRISR